MTRVAQQIAAIRRAIQRIAPLLKVEAGRGSVYGWVYIQPSPRRDLTIDERQALEGLGIVAGHTGAVLPPERRKETANRIQESDHALAAHR